MTDTPTPATPRLAILGLAAVLVVAGGVVAYHRFTRDDPGAVTRKAIEDVGVRPRAPVPFPDDQGPAEGSAATPQGRTVTFPDGIALTLDKVERMPNRLGAEVPTDRAIVRVTWTFRNTTGEPVPIEPRTRYLTVLSGPNRVQGRPEAGYADAGPDEQLQTVQDATSIAPGTGVAMVESSTVPAADLGDLAVRIRRITATGARVAEPFTFIDAEAMLVTR